MKNYYTEFLQKTNFSNTPGKAVSKVSKDQITTQKKTSDTFDTTLLGENEKYLNQALTKADETKTPGSESLIAWLNRMISAGVSFEVSIDNFEIRGNHNAAEAEFLTINKTAVLCTLQQALLAKYLFAAKPKLLKEFIARINERDARFEAVCEITQKWFARLLETMAN